MAQGLSKYYGRLPGILFAIALIDASIIGASAVSLSTAYALGDVLSLKHSLHRKPTDAIGFYVMYCGLILLAALLVLLPNIPLGLLVNAVQTLAGVLLPSATVFLLLLCNDREVLGPWVNARLTNVFTALIVAVLVLMSIILTASVVFPTLSGFAILMILLGGGVLGVLVVLALACCRIREQSRQNNQKVTLKPDLNALYLWRMPPLDQLKPMVLSGRNKLWMAVLRGYLLLAVGMAHSVKIRRAGEAADAAAAAEVKA